MVLIAFTAACGQGPAQAPTPSASPTALARQISLPGATPLILYHDPANFDQLDGMTWDGQIRGRIGPGFRNGGIPNAQGTLFSTTSDIRDRSGSVVATFDSTNASIFWADDGRSYCSLARTGSRDVASPAELQVVLPGHAPMDVARVGTFSPAGLNAGGPYLVACSPGSDRAVVVQSGGQGLGTAEYWVVQLSTGNVLWRRAPENGVQLAASHDGRLVAEDFGGGGGSVVYGSDGSVTARLDTSISAFSWDGTLAVTSRTGGPVSLERWRDGTVLWRGPVGTGYGYWGGVTEPGGTRVALGLRDPALPQTGGFPPVDLYVVSADGKVGYEQKNIFLFPML